MSADDSVIIAAVFGMVIVLGLVVVAYVLLKGQVPEQPQNKICARCGHIGLPTTADPGSTLFEIALWLCGLVPGIFYTFWRKAARRQVCRSCGSAELLPLNSPRGRELQKHYSQTK